MAISLAKGGNVSLSNVAPGLQGHRTWLGFPRHSTLMPVRF